MKPKRRKAPKSDIPRTVPRRYPGHLKFVRGFECVAKGRGPNMPCSGRIEAAHVRSETDGGTAEKPSDWWTIPLCTYHHREQHLVGETMFEIGHSIDMKAIATSIAKQSRNRAIKICAGRKAGDVSLEEIFDDR